MQYNDTSKTVQPITSPTAKKSRKCAPACTCGRHKKRNQTSSKTPSINNNVKHVETPVFTGLNASEAPPLGINAKSSTTLESNRSFLSERSEGENEPTPNILKINSIRRERYALGRTARAIYAKEGERRGLRYVLNFHRTAHCAYTAIGDEVDVWESSEHKRCHFKGLTFCGSVWTCPNCAARIQESRRGEIAQAIEHFYDVGKKAVMITFTFPHALGDDLEGLLSKQAQALKILREGRVWSLFKKRAGFEGLIRSLEVTYGEHGYHPHTHELWFVARGLDAGELKKFVVNRWLSSCIKAGLVDAEDKKTVEAFMLHAVDVKDNAKASDYLAKQDDSSHWGADREIAKASTKEGRKKGIHPFQFLANFHDSGDGIWAARWLEYSAAFKGKRQLFWSRGLKKCVGIDEKTDEEIIAKSESESVQVYVMELEEWRRVRRGSQAFVLELCEMTKNIDEISGVLSVINPPVDEAEVSVMAGLAAHKMNAAYDDHLSREVLEKDYKNMVDAEKVRKGFYKYVRG
ncbi:MAG: protein rep [bacterium]|nr:protein rep [bacterium]